MVEVFVFVVEIFVFLVECFVFVIEEFKDVKVEVVEIFVDIKEDVVFVGKVFFLISGIRKVGVVSILSLVIIIEFNYFCSVCWFKINWFFVLM